MKHEYEEILDDEDQQDGPNEEEQEDQKSESSEVSDKEEADPFTQFRGNKFKRDILPAETDNEDLEKDELLKKMIEAGDEFPDGAYIDHSKYPCFFKRMV